MTRVTTLATTIAKTIGPQKKILDIILGKLKAVGYTDIHTVEDKPTDASHLHNHLDRLAGIDAIATSTDTKSCVGVAIREWKTTQAGIMVRLSNQGLPLTNELEKWQKARERFQLCPSLFVQIEPNDRITYMTVTDLLSRYALGDYTTVTLGCNDGSVFACFASKN